MTERRFLVSETPLAGLKLIERRQLSDERGSLQRLFCNDELAAAGFTLPVAQVNHTSTRAAGTIRGLHFQRPPHAEDKLVSVLRGDIFDVAVDVRRGSATFGQWHGERLSAQNGRGLLIPRGFAHGFQTLCDDCELLYVHSAAYHAPSEGGLDALDPALAIAWPLPVAFRSPRDRALPMLADDFQGITS